jgi:hypothetical protein
VTEAIEKAGRASAGFSFTGHQSTSMPWSCPTKTSGSALRTANQARTDFAIIEDELEAIYARLARLPSRGQLWRVCLKGVLGGSVLTTGLSLAFAAAH